MSVLGWLEMQEEDQPPPEIWLDNEKLEMHFKEVQERYASDSDKSEKVEDPEGGMMENELMRGVRR